MLTILSALLGGLLRMAPEIMKFLDKRNERAHELAMFDKQLEADKLKASAAQALEETRGANALQLGDLQALIEATKAQAQKTSIAWVDAVNSTVRPFLTYWWAVILYTVAMACEFYGLVWISHQPAWSSMLQIFGEPEKAIAASMISFWFVDRTIMHMRGRAR